VEEPDSAAGPAVAEPPRDPFVEAKEAIRELQNALTAGAGQPEGAATGDQDEAREPAGDAAAPMASTVEADVTGASGPAGSAPLSPATSGQEPIVSPEEQEALRAMQALQDAQRRNRRRPWWRIW